MIEPTTRTVILDERLHALRMRRYLLTIEGPHDSQHRVLAQRRVMIGTGPDCDIVLEDPAVSREHAAIEVDATGYRILDLGSKNGIRVGDVVVRDATLAPKTRLTLGETVVTFETTSEQVDIVYSGRTRFGGLIGASMQMREVFAAIDQAALTERPILFEGRSGTGKELAASAAHRHSHRRGAPFVVFDCAAVSVGTLEDELFGDKGALAEAGAGTLFLDEIDALPLELQARLGRWLEASDVAVGEDHKACRIMSAADHDLQRDVEQGGFKGELYYLLAAHRVVLPPLKDRAEDIPLLVEHFLIATRDEVGNPGLNLTYATMERLKSHPWPGNVRELKAFIDRAAQLASGDGSIDAAPRTVVSSETVEDGRPRDGIDALMRLGGATTQMPFKDAKARLVEAFERQYWIRLLEQNGGNVSAAARTAGVHRKSVEYILKKLEIDRTDPSGSKG
ncbi:MAG: DNA-binding NtrC family response regulator [Bradymonadia bacterium]|jgi:DNA-binding NtrC family response regulator